MPKPPDNNLLKCRFCEFTVLRYRRDKNGKVRHGHARLEHHVLDAHYFVNNYHDYGPYREALLQEQAAWLADPATLDEVYEDEHDLPLEEQA